MTWTRLRALTRLVKGRLLRGRRLTVLRISEDAEEQARSASEDRKRRAYMAHVKAKVCQPSGEGGQKPPRLDPGDVWRHIYGHHPGV